MDIVIDLRILADTEAYHTLEDSLKKMGFERAENEAGKKRSWRWDTCTGKHGAVIEASLAILRRRFANDEKTEGYRKDAPSPSPSSSWAKAMNSTNAKRGRCGSVKSTT